MAISERTVLRWYIGLATAGQVVLALAFLTWLAVADFVGLSWLAGLAILLVSGFFFILVTQAKSWCRRALAKLNRREVRGY